jgi:hypothetical protein
LVVSPPENLRSLYRRKADAMHSAQAPNALAWMNYMSSIQGEKAE